MPSKPATGAHREPEWMAPFLAALRAEPKVRAAARAANVALSTAYHRRRMDPDFAREWDEARGKPIGDGASGRGGTRRIGAKKIERFLETLAESSNVRAAADAAGIAPRAVYRLRRDDPDFARAWYAALAEGYDNLEMEMLEHLRCLVAHRENVAREKGRRALADEVTTIASINAKIDALRQRARANDRTIRKSRRKAARDGEG